MVVVTASPCYFGSLNVIDREVTASELFHLSTFHLLPPSLRPYPVNHGR